MSDPYDLARPDPGSPTSALAHARGQIAAFASKLADTQSALAKSQQDLTAMQRQRDQARSQAEHWLAKTRELARDLAHAEFELAESDNKARVWRNAADEYATERDQWKADAERTMATLHDVALDLQRTKHQNRLLTDGAVAAEPAVQVARQDVGPCGRCGRPIVRGQAVEALPDTTTKPRWAHAVCPDPEEMQ